MSNSLLLQTDSRIIRSSLKRYRREGGYNRANAHLTDGCTFRPPIVLSGHRPQKGGKMAQIEYTRHGDYLLPNIILDEPPRELTEPITRYGAMRRAFLREHHPITYSRLLLSERLFPHLREVQQETHERLDRIMSDILVFQPPPDKAADGLAWAAHMTEIHRLAEKMMLDEIVYA